MDQPTQFEQLMERVIGGDQDAATELFELYREPILRAARARMRNSRLRREIDSNDILNTVMKSFFARVKDVEGDWKLDTPENLLKLLRTMAKNKVIKRTRSQDAKKRGGKMTEISPEFIDGIVRENLTPDEIVAIKELAQLVWDRMSPELRNLYQLRIEDKLPWDKIGRRIGCSAEACRKQTTRGFEEIAKQFKDNDIP